MSLATVPVAEAEGAVLVHSLRAGSKRLGKGRVITAADVRALAAAGIGEITVIRPGPADIGEDAAAGMLGRALAGTGLVATAPHVGRVNLLARERGLLVVDAGAVDRFNAVDESLTLATLPRWSEVEVDQIVATVKVVPLVIDRGAVERACTGVASDLPLRVARFRSLAVALVQTTLPGIRDEVLEKTTRVTAERARFLGCAVVAEMRCAHRVDDVASALGEVIGRGAEVILVLGASAIADRSDVVPAAVTAAGGVVERFGLPVDPGNLLLLARIGEVPLLGLPGSARSPRFQGADQVLRRLVADVPTTAADLAAMGVGGLLKEIPDRPEPRVARRRARARAARHVAALVLAAGRSSRMGGVNKLLAEVDGRALVAHVVDAALASHADGVWVVVGHDAGAVRAALAERAVTFVDNPDYREGLSRSLARGLAALPADCDGVLVCLGDMPLVGAAALDRLIAAFDPGAGRAICVPTRDGRRGNPVLWPRQLFTEIAAVSGDVGARHLIGERASEVHEVEMDDDSVFFDVDSPAMLARLAPARDEG